MNSIEWIVIGLAASHRQRIEILEETYKKFPCLEILSKLHYEYGKYAALRELYLHDSLFELENEIERTCAD